MIETIPRADLGAGDIKRVSDMQTVHETMKVIAEAVGLSDLALNSNGQAELIFNGDFSAYITKIDDQTLELSFRLSHLDFADPAMMRAMLQANALGAGTGGGRLAIDPGKNETIYCERWTVADMTPASAEKRILEFAQYGAFWMTEGTDMLLEEAESQNSSGLSDEMEQSEEITMIRV